MKRNPNYHKTIDVPFWTINKTIFFEKRVKGKGLVDNVFYVMDWFKNYEHGLNSPDEKVVIGRDEDGFLHVGVNYPKNIARTNNTRDLKKQEYNGIVIHTMDVFGSVRALDTLLTVLLRDKIISRDDLSEQKTGEFNHTYRKLEQVA